MSFKLEVSYSFPFGGLMSSNSFRLLSRIRNIYMNQNHDS